ncbi:CDP-glucose 4,6-dehydratase [Pseudodesulfovibrio sp. F-1]|uniref:CDP-glucose 4,6-dehydratase n=1 Tax=Pseudodesulfovibrio alkaliphilus TaxID=2661613 RepID=A0A7K1KQ61_9BACT|nr:CDP-glucose 4,6-dehydratase [Pseudodesulfovibrio alkaliphilus]MUM78100.1 CDP-glucose 4,6-dehydratase [Pseudodesulfovibrio alkaliphilus]
MFDGFFNGKKIFLTGDTGFKGGWLALWLKKMGAQVGAFALPPHTSPSLYQLADVGSAVTRLGGDIRNREEITSAIAGFAPDIVIHMAAQALVRPSYKAPLETFDTNVMGTANLLDAVRKTDKVKAVVIVTSDKCYENREWVWGYRENDPMGGHDPYSASKGCAELVTASFIRSYFKNSGTAVASVRAGNVIGGGDFAEDRLIPDMVRSFTRGEPVCIRSPQATRPWQHVLEPLSGYLLLARRLLEKGQDFGGGWNFGPADESTRTVGEVVTTFGEKWGEEASSRPDTHTHPHEPTLLRLDCSKANLLLDWKPKSDFSTALDWTIAWYKAWSTGADCAALTLNQIEAFENL